METNQPEGAGGIMDANNEEMAAGQKLVNQLIDFLKGDIDAREKIYRVRRDFFEGRHHLYSNVVGLRGKERQGHILAVFNYIHRFCARIQQAFSTSPMRFKIVPEDEADEIESIRAESEENWIRKILRDNKFWEVKLPRNVSIQLRDGDFAIKTVVETDEREGKQIKIYHAENLEKLHVVWDDASGENFSGVIYKDLWTLEKISREFNGYKAEAVELDREQSTSESTHTDQYGVFASTSVASRKTPTGKDDKIPKAWVADFWGWLKVRDEETGQPGWKMCNIIMINKDVVQFSKTDYDYNPWTIGHSFDNPGSPWSKSYIDDLIDPQVELNDRQSDEGDMIRIGANIKYVVLNMPNFDTTSIKPGSGQAIFIEGENADFKQLETNVNPFPSEAYLNRTMDHLFNLGLPKIAISAGNAPYTGRIGVIQYQAVSDLVDMIRIKWSPVLKDVFKRIQSYTIKFFPEAAEFMMAHDGDTGQDYGPVMREVEFDWDSILPQSRSDAIVDMATLYDRDMIPLKRALEMAGFRDPMRIIKELKKENADPELVTIKSKFRQFSQGVITAQLEARKQTVAAEEQNAEMAAASQPTPESNNPPTPPANKPVLQRWQNSGRRGPPATAGVGGVGQTASAQGYLNQVAQNLRAGGK